MSDTAEFDTVTDTAEFDTVTDEIRRWSTLSADECQRFVEDGVLNEFEMMWQLRALFQAACVSPGS
jgi:hypothetical protein